MAKFFYKALKDNKTEVKGYVEAESSREAREKIRNLGFLPTNIHEESFETPAAEKTVPKVKSLSLSEKILFTSELHVMIASSIPIIDALETVEEHAHKPKVQILASDLKDKIMKGQTFSEALKSYDKVFDPVYIGLCAAGEESGSLEKTFEYILSVLKKQDDLKARIISMSVYPVITVVFLIAVFLLCGVYIFPAFIKGANISAGDIPFTVKFVVGACDFIFQYWMLVNAAMAGGVFALIKLWEQSFFKRFIDKLLLNIPLVRDFVRYINLSSFFTVLNVAYESGVTIVSSLELGISTISNSVIKQEGEISKKLVDKGGVLSQSFLRSNLLPPVFNTLIVTGEKSGRLGQMFRDIAIGIDKRLDMVTNALSKAFEPALLVIIGIVVGYIVVAYFQLYGSMIKGLF